MSNLVESSVFEVGVYQFETDDPVLGGNPIFDAGSPVAGHCNAQAQQLANRTKWLYDNKANISDGVWNGQTLSLGAYQLWVDSTGALRIKNGTPISDTDGIVVGTQS